MWLIPDANQDCWLRRILNPPKEFTCIKIIRTASAVTFLVIERYRSTFHVYPCRHAWIFSALSLSGGMIEWNQTQKENRANTVNTTSNLHHENDRTFTLLDVSQYQSPCSVLWQNALTLLLVTDLGLFNPALQPTDVLPPCWDERRIHRTSITTSNMCPLQKPGIWLPCIVELASISQLEQHWMVWLSCDSLPLWIDFIMDSARARIWIGYDLLPIAWRGRHSCSRFNTPPHLKRISICAVTL